MKQFWACQPRPAKSASASLTPAWIFSAVLPGGNAGSEKSTVAGSKPTNRTRFIAFPEPRPYSRLLSNGTDQQEADDKHHPAGYAMNGERSRLRPTRPQNN